MEKMMFNSEDALLNERHEEPVEEVMTLKERFKREDEPKPEKVSKYQGDIEALEHHFGDLKDRTIETSLIEIGKIVYRKRKRVDAYNGLAKTLKRSRNTTLTITSNKTKKVKP